MNLPDNPGQWSRKVGILVYESERGEYFHKLWLQLKETIGWNRPFFYIVSSSMTGKCKIGQTNAENFAHLLMYQRFWGSYRIHMIRVFRKHTSAAKKKWGDSNFTPLHETWEKTVKKALNTELMQYGRPQELWGYRDHLPENEFYRLSDLPKVMAIVNQVVKNEDKSDDGSAALPLKVRRGRSTPPSLFSNTYKKLE